MLRPIENMSPTCRYMNLRIEQVEQLGQTFDLIVCTGVFHHLDNGDAGLSALR